MRDLTRKLARPVRRLLGRDDRGAVGVLVGVLLGGGVLLGMGALTIDVGMLYTERAELQNGADAGALGVAKSCALGACTPDVASTYADANANRDGAAAVPLVCGSDDEGALGGCPASSGTIVDCPAAPASGNYVDVHTATEEAGGETLLPPALAQALLGNGDYGGSTVKACARASWGAPATAKAVAFTISFCEWQQATGADASGEGGAFPDYPPYPSPSFVRVLALKTPQESAQTECTDGPAGADGPGQFGWTDNDGTCSTDIDYDSQDSGSYGAEPGNSVAASCQTLLSAARASGTPILIPIYRDASGTGQNGTYGFGDVGGFAAFVVTGYELPSFKAPDLLNSDKKCDPGQSCIFGFFTQALVPGNGETGGPDLGATIISLTD